jgi:hypothetical protein
MKRILIILPDDSAEELKQMAKDDMRSVKATAEKIVLDAIAVRSDGLTDEQYVKLNRGVK